jgi:hypothetical protein
MTDSLALRFEPLDGPPTQVGVIPDQLDASPVTRTDSKLYLVQPVTRSEYRPAG